MDKENFICKDKSTIILNDKEGLFTTEINFDVGIFVIAKTDNLTKNVNR